MNLVTRSTPLFTPNPQMSMPITHTMIVQTTTSPGFASIVSKTPPTWAVSKPLNSPDAILMK